MAGFRTIVRRGVRFLGWGSRKEAEDALKEERNEVINPEPGIIPAAYSAINLLSQTLAQCPKYVVKLGPLPEPGMEREMEPQTEHPVTELLHHPSQFMTPFLFYEWYFSQLFTDGNGYAEITRRQDTRTPMELVPAIMVGTPQTRARRRIIVTYPSQNLYSREMRGIRAPNMLNTHGPQFSIDSLESPSPVTVAARKSLNVMEAAMQHQYSILRRHNLGVAILANPEMRHEKAGRLDAHYKSIRKNLAMAQRYDEPPIFPPGFDTKRATGLSAADIQLIEILRWTIEDVARVWNVQLNWLHHFRGGISTAQNSDSSWTRFLARSIAGPAERIGQAFTAKLLTPEERLMDLAVKVDWMALAQRDQLEEMSAAAGAMPDDAGHAGESVPGQTPNARLNGETPPLHVQGTRRRVRV